jgi:hypothetical protein
VAWYGAVAGWLRIAWHVCAPTSAAQVSGHMGAGDSLMMTGPEWWLAVRTPDAAASRRHSGRYSEHSRCSAAVRLAAFGRYTEYDIVNIVAIEA